VICADCEEKYVLGGCELDFDKLKDSSSAWTDDDEAYWQSLLALEPQPKSRTGTNPIGDETMIQVQRNNVPQGTQQAARGVQFLKPIHATKEGVKATITKVSTDKPDNFGNPYVVYMTINGQRYSKGFKPTSDNLASLVDLLGSDESKWIKKSITVFRVTDDEGSERLAFGK